MRQRQVVTMRNRMDGKDHLTQIKAATLILR